MIRILTSLFVLILSSNVWGEDCAKAIELFNKATMIRGLEVKEHGFKKAVPLCSDPEILSRVYNNLADTYERTGRFSLALAYYKKALETKPNLATSYFSVGDIFFKLRDYYSATVMYEKGLKYRYEDKESLERKEEAVSKMKMYMVIYFDFDSFRIPERYSKRMALVGKTIKEIGIDTLSHISVIGHSCSLGPSAYNRRLSLRRAEEAAKYFKERFSVASSVVVVTPKGEDTPLFSGVDRTAYDLNRRVEIKLRFKGE